MVAKRWRVAMLRLGFVVLTGGLLLSGTANVVKADLDEYVKKPDPAFAWSRDRHQHHAGGDDHQPQAHVAGLAGYHVEARPHGLRTARDRLSGRRAPVHHGGRRPPAGRATMITRQAFGLAQLCGARVAVLTASPQPAAPGRQERGRVDRRDVSSATSTPRTKTGRCSSRWSRVRSGRWMPSRPGPRKRASRR